MKRFLLLLFLLAGMQLYAQEEYIRSFHADLKIDTTGLLTVTETIEVYAAGQQIQRGIVRSLPLSGTDYRYKQVKTEYDVIEVKKDGQTSPFHMDKKEGNLNIYVGDRQTILSPGYYTYEISYSAQGQLGYFEDYDEIYWNVNGFGWPFRVEVITATVHLPMGASWDQNACYTGYSGSTEQNCQVSTLEDGSLRFSAKNLSPYQNLTVAAGFTKGIVSPPAPLGIWQKYGLLAVSIGTFLFLLLYYSFTWARYGVDPPSPTVIPEFDPPTGLSPASTGMINKGYFWGELISASIVNLAVNGFLKINEIKKPVFLGIFSSTTFVLEKHKEVDESLSKEERILMDRLFASGEKVTIDGKYNAQMKTMYDSYMASLVNEHRPLLTQGSNWKFWIPPIFVFLLYAWMASKFDYFNYEVKSMDFNLSDLSIWPFVTFLTVMVSLGIIRTNFTRWLFSVLLISTLIGIVYVLFISGSISFNNFVLIGFIVLNVFAYLIYIYLIRKPSVEKLELKAKIKGFKKYLSAAEERQIQMFNPPKMTPEIFEKLLPYAMAFKVDKIWGNKFQRLVDRASLRQGGRSNWYSGPRAYSYGMLGRHLNRSLGASLNQSAGRGSSGGSGSRGGGSSGGGRGGGGGGGW
ncbi:MAG: DUF2207 domain-containing protein [Cecembia sp.]